VKYLPVPVAARSKAARLLRFWVRIPPGTLMSDCWECCVLSGRGLCDELITRPEEQCRLWCVVVYDLETSSMRRPLPSLGRSATGKSKIKYLSHISSIHSVLRQRDRFLFLLFLNVTLVQILLSLLFLVAHLRYLPSSFFRSKIKSEQRSKIDIKA